MEELDFIVILKNGIRCGNYLLYDGDTVFSNGNIITNDNKRLHVNLSKHWLKKFSRKRDI